MQRNADAAFVLLGQDVVEVVLDHVRHQDGGLYGTRAATGRAGLAGHDVHLGPYPLPGDLHQAEFRKRQHGIFRALGLHLLAHDLVNPLLVVGLLHINEVHHDDATHVAQPQLPGDFLGRFGVYAQGRRFLVFLAIRLVAAVDVDDVQRLGMLDDEVASTRQADRPPEQRLDLLFQPELLEYLVLAVMEFQNTLLLRGNGVQVSLRIFKDIL